MNSFIKWHKKIAEDFMKLMGIDHYGLMWYSWFEGFVVGIFLFWLLS